ncbi:MAG: molecular chaperone TorD family protein [Ideonella sp.]
MNPDTSPDNDDKIISFDGGDEGVELARAELYGLLAGLWLAAPDRHAMERFAVAVTEAPEPGSFLEAPWQAVVASMRSTSVDAAAAEYDALFMGVGRPDVMLFGSFYLAGFLNETPLVLLRTDLIGLRLGRDQGRYETEDHIAHEFEVMRYLIAGDDLAICNLEQQRRFFRTHIQPWVHKLCEAVTAHPRAALYLRVAELTDAFMQIETQGFDMLEG